MSDSAVLPRSDAAAELAPWLGDWADSATPAYCRDASGRILCANSAFARKFGRTAAELQGMSAVQCVHPDDVASFKSPPARGALAAFEGGRAQRWLTPQGWRWFSWEETSIAATEARPAFVRAAGRDITRQRLAEELYLKLSRAVDQSPISIVITDARGRVQYVNPRYSQMTGCSLEDTLDRNVPVLRDGHTSDDSYQEFLETLRGGREWQGELCRRTADGKTVWESVQATCMRNSAGEITNILCMREDVTERRRLQDELRQAQKMESLGTLAGGIAHDFNNLLAVMSGYADISLLHPDDAPLLQKSMREIKRAVQRASGLVRQILTFSRKAEIHFAALDLNQMVREITMLLAETFPRTVSLGLQLQEGLPALVADQNQLQQIVLNLCVNARDAMPGGGIITLATSLCPRGSLLRPDASPNKTYVCLKVSDTGTGMSPEVRARIFEPFFTTKQINQGTGLGLAVVYGIVTAHQGFIDVESTVGEGTTFVIYLPASESAQVSAVVAPPAEFPTGRESILVVDDEDPLRKLLTTALSRKGYRITCACDGLEAIDRIANPAEHYDAVLLDLNMPGASGLAVLKEIKSRRPPLKVMMVSGHLSNEIRAEFEQLGQRDFLSKPYSLDELGQRLRKLLDGA